MAAKKKEPSTYTYGATQGHELGEPSSPDMWYAVVYPDSPDADGVKVAYRGTSGYASLEDALTEARAWCSDRGITAHQF